jgi:hypothetical protein
MLVNDEVYGTWMESVVMLEATMKAGKPLKASVMIIGLWGLETGHPEYGTFLTNQSRLLVVQKRQLWLAKAFMCRSMFSF